MGITIDVVREAADTGGGNQSFTGSLGGLTPKAALFILSFATSDGTAKDGAVLSWGIADDTREFALSISDEHGVTTTNNDTVLRNDSCIIAVEDDGVTDGLASFVSFAANTVTVNWSATLSAAYLVTCTLFAGSDLSAYAGSADLGNGLNGVTDITAPTFEPDVVFTAMSAQHTTFNATEPDANIALGVVHNDGASTITQRTIGLYWDDSAATSECNGMVRADGGVIEVSSAGALDFYGEFGTFDANGFSVTNRNAGGNNRDLLYLALNFNSVVEGEVITYSTPTGTGSDSVSSLGFEPGFVYLIGTFAEAVNTAYTDGSLGTLMVSTIDAGSQFANSASAEDAQGTADTQSLSDNVPVQLPDHDGTAGLTASFTSLDSNGWTFNYSAVEASAKLFFALAIEADAGAAAGNPWYAYAQQ